MAYNRLNKLFIWHLKQPKRWRLGFTMMEILIGIAIVGTLAGIAIPVYIGYRDNARVAEAIVEMDRIGAAITNYWTMHGELPDSLNDVGLGNLKDPWGNPYEYLRIAGGDPNGLGSMRKDHALVPVNTDYDLYSKGKDCQSSSPFTAKASQDDIVRANDGGYLGLVSDY